MKIEDKVKEIIIEQLGVSKQAILGNDLGADSLDVIEIKIALDEEYGIKVENIKETWTVGKVINTVKNLLKKKQKAKG